MTSGQKVAVSLLISVFIFAVFTVAAFSGLFSVMETRFYQPALVRGISERLDAASKTLDDYLHSSEKTFYDDFVQNEYVKKSFAFEQLSEDIKGREDASGALFAAVPSLTGIRIIESGGKRIHYSTIAQDILQRSEKLVSYRMYKDTGDLDYADIESSDSDTKGISVGAGSAAGQVGGHSRIICDPDRDRILFSFPFYDSYSVYRGTIVFYTAASAFSRELVKLNLLAMTDNVIFTGTAERPVFVLDFPNTGRNILQDILIKKFSGDVSFTEKIMETDKSDVWLLFSKKSASNIYVSRLYEENLFVFSDTVRILLLASVFITAYLIIFLIFNVKQDDMLIIRERIKRFQFAVINDYLAAKEEVDWNAVYADMNRRKAEINGAIKKSLGGKAKRHARETDLLLEKSWDEILSALHRQSAAKEKPNLDMLTAELKEMMGKIISSRDFAPAASPVLSAASPQFVPMQAVPAAGEPAVPVAKIAADAEPVDEVEPVLEAEPVDEAEAVHDAEFAEPVDDAEPVLEAEPVDEAEAAAPEVSADASTAAGDVSAEEPEELEEVEEAEPVSEEAEEIPKDAEAVEELEEIPEAEEVEELEELEEVPAADEPAEVLAEEPSAKAESADKRTDAGGEDIFDLDFVKDSAVLAGLENNEDEVADVPQTPAAAEEKTDDLLDRSFFELASAKKAVNEEKPAAEDGEDEEGEDIFNEELKIGETQTEKNAAHAVSSSNSENDFSDFKIEKPDFSILDEPASGIMPASAAVVSEAATEPTETVAATAVPEAEGTEADFVEPLPFSFTFGKIGEKAADLHSADEPILERDGLFVIAKEAGENVTKQKLDAEFQMLVDSVLK
ncbi:hypothetical protein HMPREF9194_01858 [Treponema maltophilum ATCC 51939]|uniref:Uncharacterized protein n=2 Tax=Treponema maltophilum TaxID=51160 RepID=S3K3H8_TREMA|nr:hypothetical protein HMPREF9194_01858 [Treponema maltophilum ATCC 51939]